MPRRGVVIGSILLLVLAIAAGILLAAIPKMGYCFGVSFSPGGDSLYVAAGYRGLHTLRVGLEGELEYISLTNDGGYYRYVEALEDLIYVANSKVGLMVYGVETGEPELLWSQSGSKAYGIHIVDGLAFVAAEREGLDIFDLANPRSPERIGHIDYDGRAWDVWVNGQTAYVADPDRGLLAFDVSTPSDPGLVGELTWGPGDPSAEILEGQGSIIYVASGNHGLLAIDVSDPTRPVKVWRYDPGPDTFGESLVLGGHTLFATMIDEANPEENGLHIFDIEEPSAPVLARKFPIRDWVEDVTLTHDRMAIANTHSGVLLFGIEDLHTLPLLDTHPAALWRFLTRTLRW